MKKINKIIIYTITIILFISIAIYIYVKDKNYLYIPNNLIETTDLQLNEKINNEDKFVLYVYGDTCKYCEKFYPILDKVLQENNVKAYQICSDKNDDYFNMISQVLAEKFQGTPAVYFYENGKIIDYFIGIQDESIIQKYIDKNVIK